jgi:hypothetical protein
VKSWLALAAAAALLGGCTGGTETGNPSFDAKLSYTAYSSRPSAVTVRDPAIGRADVSAAWLVLGDVRFERASSCDPEATSNPRAPALGVGNHANNAPASTAFEMNGDDYCGVDVAFVHTDGVSLPAEAPASLVENTVVLEGTAPDGTPFTVESEVAELLHLPNDIFGGTFAMSPAMPHMLMVFDVGIWLGSLDWSRATVTSGEIVISATENPSLHQAFVGSLRSGIRVIRDDEGNGQVDPGAEVLADGGQE